MKLEKLIGKGIQADVYEYEGYAVKLFHQRHDKSYVFFESAKMSMIEKTDLPTPKIHDVRKIGDRWAIVMDLVEGVPVAYDMKNSLVEFVDLQIRMHKIDIFSLADNIMIPNSHYICRSLIKSNGKFNSTIKSKLLKLLDCLPVEDKLCHNDYHGLNVIKNQNGLSIIDWTGVTGGSPESDCCRTYMITKFHHKEYAEPFLSTYCTRSNICSDRILRWLPIMAADWLHRSPENEDPQLTEWLSQV